MDACPSSHGTDESLHESQEASHEENIAPIINNRGAPSSEDVPRSAVLWALMRPILVPSSADYRRGTLGVPPIATMES
jgi:hypothetical protein